MKNTEFHIFKNNTDAPSTNKGFYLQYLLTLQLWIERSGDENFEIYCEREDDILLIDLVTGDRHYTQVKCYSEGFSLNSDELLKSLINFYKLYLRYGSNSDCIFRFSTNSTTRPRAGQILKLWQEKQRSGDYMVDDFLVPVRNAVNDYIDRLVGRYEKSIRDSGLLVQARVKSNELLSQINGNEFQLFLERIRWDFQVVADPDLHTITNDIANSLAKVEYNRNVDVKVFLSYLLHHVIEKSTLLKADERLLDAKLFRKLAKDTENKNLLIKTLENELLTTFGHLSGIKKQLVDIGVKTSLILTKIDNLDRPPKLKLELFFDDLRAWFDAIDYKQGQLQVMTDSHLYFDIVIRERKGDTKVLVYGIVKPIQVPHVKLVESLKKEYDCDEAWVVSTSHPSPAALKLTQEDADKDIVCYNFDELLEETIDFSNYFKWVEDQIFEKKIDERFIPLGAKKGEYNEQTKEIEATSIYGEKEGWLEGYLNTWINDQQKEHVSILGEFGTGKTWFTLYYTWKQIQKYQQAKLERTPRPRLPILIYLRDFAKAMQVEVLISDFFFRKHKIEIKGVFAAFTQLNKMGKFLLLFDGFDEMADRIDKQKMVDNFWELASVVKGQSKVVLTCRNEHFATIREGRHLLNAEFKNSTKMQPNESPQFEVVELLKFNNEQIRRLLSHFTSNETIEIIFRNYRIVELLSRPLMIELIIDALQEVTNQVDINLAKIYFYATKRKMERDISQQRTFTSLSDKIFFMSELAWEMLSNEKLTINFKEFPDIIYHYFNIPIEDKNMDYWRYDMRGQSLLVIDEEEGNYKPAHKSMLEFFVAYKFAADLGILRPEFNVNMQGTTVHRKTKKRLDELNETFGRFQLQSPQLNVVFDFLKDLINESISILWELFDEGFPYKKNYTTLLGNFVTLLTIKERDFHGRDFSDLELFNPIFRDSDLTYCNFENTILRSPGFLNSDLHGCNFKNAQFLRDGPYPVWRDVNGHTCFDFTASNDLVSVAHLGFKIVHFQDGKQDEFFKFKDASIFITKLIVVKKSNTLIANIRNGLSLLNLNNGETKIFNFQNFTPDGLVINRQETLLATFSDGFGRGGELKIHELENPEKYREIIFSNSGLFSCCFFNLSNQLIAGGRDGKVFFIDIGSQSLSKTLDLHDISGKYEQVKANISHGTYFVYSLAISSDDRLLAVASVLNDIYIWDIPLNKLFKTIHVGNDYAVKVHFSPNDKYLVYYAVGKGVVILQTSDWEEIYSLNESYEVIRFSPDSRYVAFSDSYEDNNIIWLDLKSLQVFKRVVNNFDLSQTRISGLQAPSSNVKYFLDRGAKGWFTKEELLQMEPIAFKKFIETVGHGKITKYKSRKKQVALLTDYLKL
ncbi:pentapeptide repeat-containing protein [Mucilaginibacter sp. BJC16-A38]|uniref:pentapeptide repeat-containing protein n=1 Tax=Mucilaginibacter phenanthrenivorans TaxID=1234842 RepID=UPI0021576250|nr:pentapeptide repeat-containing protein [Mucilaginibacter phenanthrenivorans]MCR8557988.1 pentapeptide repeat-containing protein [Mucilaginibacter phenanthrenivorans]